MPKFATAAQPIARRRLSLIQLTPDEFELLCFWVIGLTFPDAVRVTNPDGGVDAGLPLVDRSWERCWQAKRYTSHIQWPQCVESLDAADANYGMKHYTFCFARDLSHGQEKLFKKHLVGRHPGVLVDYWGQSRIEGLLLGCAQGERIANEFFGDPTVDTRALMRAFRAAGSLETGTEVLDRIAAIAEHLATRDPLYQYVHVGTEAGGPMPGLTPQTVVAVHLDRGDSRIRIDAVPRNAKSIEEPPGGTVRMLPEQAEQFERFLLRGGELELENVKIEFKNLPSVFEDIGPTAEEMHLKLQAPRMLPTPWRARFTITGSAAIVNPIELLLEPTNDVDSAWDAALVGRTEGFTVSVLFRKRQQGEMMVNWSYNDDATVPASVRAPQLAFVEALHRRGELVIDDLEGSRPRLALDMVDRRIDPAFRALRVFLENLTVVEEWSGGQLETTGRIAVDEVRAVAEMAAVIRRREASMNFEHVTLVVPQDEVTKMGDGEHQYLIEIETGLVLLGREIPIGKLRGQLTDVRVVAGEPDNNGNVRVRLEPASEEAAHPVFELRHFTDAELEVRRAD